MLTLMNFQAEKYIIVITVHQHGKSQDGKLRIFIILIFIFGNEKKCIY